MEGKKPASEAYRGLWLTVLPEWILACGVSLAVSLAAFHFGATDGRLWLVLAVVPLVWAGGRTAQSVVHLRRRAQRQPGAHGRGKGNGWALHGRPVEKAADRQSRWSAEDYDQFMQFAQVLLREWEGQGCGSVPTVPPTVGRAWLEVLKQARIVIDVPEGKRWHVSRSIRTLEDVGRRVGEEELRRAVRRMEEG
jgi:hypothetical protein